MSSFATRHSRALLLPGSSSCTRHFASSTPSHLPKSLPGSAMAGVIIDLVDGVADAVDARKATEVAQGDKTKLKEHKSAIYPPYEYSREAQSRTTFRGFAPLGPGREARHNDIFFQYGIDPRREAHNEALMSYFMTRLGKIKPRSVTGLSQRSQRLVGKAIKRAKMMGVVPMFSNSKMDKMIARTNGAIYEESPPERVEKEDEKPDADVKEDDKK